MTLLASRHDQYAACKNADAAVFKGETSGKHGDHWNWPAKQKLYGGGSLRATVNQAATATSMNPAPRPTCEKTDTVLCCPLYLTWMHLFQKLMTGTTHLTDQLDLTDICFKQDPLPLNCIYNRNIDV